MRTAIVWFRRDLRLSENPAFIEACTLYERVIPLYIYDKTSILGQAQAWWLHHSLVALKNSLHAFGLTLVLRQGDPLCILEKLVSEQQVDAIYWNRCYEPLTIEQDKKIKATFLQSGILVQSSNGSLLNEPWTIKNKSGDYFKVFTPYWRHCLQQINVPLSVNSPPRPQNVNIASATIEEWQLLPHPNWAAQFGDYWQPGEQGAHTKLASFIDYHLHGYKINRNFPAEQATSRLSPHLHFGEISPWAILRAIEQAKLDKTCDLASIEHFLAELGWREFSTYLLYHFPQLNQDNFKKEFNAFPWNTDAHALKCWQRGMTGYPLVDAGMRELWATGFMHNRVRMIVASFLTKDLQIDWRLGAQWFLDTLVDADLANNSAGWQWVAGCGADAAPYFRIFNPVLQSEKFDPTGNYIRQWVPELAELNNKLIHQPWLAATSTQKNNYPLPIIDHAEARLDALACYKKLAAKPHPH